MHNHHQRFTSIENLRSAIIDEFNEHVPSSSTFQMGYFEGKQSRKHWLVTQEDIDTMYSTLSLNIVLWCDARSQTSNSEASSTTLDTRKRKSSAATSAEATTSKRKQRDEEVSSTVDQLKELHGTKYTVPQMRLWSRMVAAGHHSSLTTPPNIPAINGLIPKRRKQESLAEAVAGIVSSMRNPDHNINQSATCANVVITSPSSTSKSCPIMGHSPSKISDLRMRYIKELRELQELLERNVLTQDEFLEQKSIILDAMRKLIQ